MKYSEFFDLEELVHPDIFNHPAIGGRCGDFLHPNTKVTLDDLREQVGPITINDWKWGGKFINSGLRCPNGDIGAQYSSHRFGCAFDLKPTNIRSEVLYFHILNSQDRYPFIGRMENIDYTNGWVHIEITTKRVGEIEIFNP